MAVIGVIRVSHHCYFGAATLRAGWAAHYQGGRDCIVAFAPDSRPDGHDLTDERFSRNGTFHDDGVDVIHAQPGNVCILQEPNRCRWFRLGEFSGTIRAMTVDRTPSVSPLISSPATEAAVDEDIMIDMHGVSVVREGRAILSLWIGK